MNSATPIAVVIGKGGHLVQLRACRLHPDCFAPVGKCPLCAWRLRRFKP